MVEAPPATTTRTLPPLLARSWQKAYRGQLLALDGASIAASLSLALLVGPGGGIGRIVSGAPDTPAFSYVVVSTILGVAWLGALLLNRCYDSSLVGRGSEEFRRVAASSAQLWAVVAIGCYVAKIELARSFVAVAFPVGLLLLFITRWTARRWLRVVRERTGTWSHRVLVLGDRAHAEDLVARLQHSTASGYQVVGVCVPGGAPAEDVHGVAVVGSLTQATIAIDLTGADTVAVTAVAGLTAQVLKRLSWELASRDIDMVVAPGLVDVAGPRIHIQPVDGLPLLHIAQPELTGPRKALKGAFDRLLALVLTVLLLPVLVAVAVVVRLSGPGPVLFKQRRIGLDGEPFTCFKFRTMVVDAEARLDALTTSDDGPILFKMTDDPRVTRAGRTLRRFSLDELPQLLNVLTGDMSLVGPRPQVQNEVDLYSSAYRRRLLVKPGLTGLWQVSGRSDLSYDESERLDLYYVENWSLATDVMILWRTFRAVVKSSGAY